MPVDTEKVLYDPAAVGNEGGPMDNLFKKYGSGPIQVKHAYTDVLKFYGWEVPNVYVMYQVYKMHKELKTKRYPQYSQIDGSDNIWICKPSFTARGVGIFCFRSLSELFNGSSKKMMCPKIV